jgi:CDP-diacylglycerol--serine O-phosphatidyltransferase
MRFPKTSLKARALMDRTRQIREQFPKTFQVRPMANKYVISLIPNIVTLMGLCVGLSAIRFALEGNIVYAVTAILIAAIIDMLDGGLARMLNSSSAMGAELDSLSDLITFGVAPSMVLYITSLNKLPHYGWMVVLLYVCCMALRLSRFNVMAQDADQPRWISQFFIGVPAPMGAYLSLVPTMFSFYTENKILHEWEYCFYIIVISFFLVSRIPTFSLKKVTVQQKYVIPLMLISIFMMGAFLTEPWLCLSIMSIVYFLSIPLSTLRYRKYLAI